VVLAGIGDDCAILRPGPDEDLLITTDLAIENVHFRLATHTPAAIGRKVLARGLSDIAAMGGLPRACFLSLALPESISRSWIDAFYRGLLRLCRETGTTLAGGDLARADRVICDIVVYGAVPRGQALRRDKARPGDAIYVSGELGGSSLGLERQTGASWRRHLSPQPRLRLGRFLREKLKVKAAMDLSDGLSMDLHRLARASGLAASLDRPLPVFPGATLDHVLHGGEDYELLFTARPSTPVPHQFERIALTRIGTICNGKPGAVDFFGRPLAALGYDHFRRQ
jgi:thiamine-monophosphate kinase